MTRFEYSRDVAFCDTDAMAVVHHSNYLKYFEEARVAWMRHRHLHETHFPHTDVALAVIESRIKHHQPLQFGDRWVIQMQVRRERSRVYFRYAMHSEKNKELIASGETTHVAVNKELRPTRLARQLLSILENEPWIETWPWNLSE